MSDNARSKPLILVADDEEHITELVAMGLGFNGFDVERVGNGRSALDSIELRRPDLVILDVMMPDLGGFDVAKRIRQNERAGKRMPIIFLTAKDTTADKVEGLRLGGDDYVTKPFSIEELIERVKAVLRRAGGITPGDERITIGNLVIDEETRDVWRGERFIELTPTEFKLLHYLASNSPRVLTREQILEAVWDITFTSNASVLDTYVSYLRHKVDVEEPHLIQTVRGVGFALRLPPGH